MSNSRKYTVTDLVDVRDQKDALDDLRSGRKNMIIATSALEEGIDVSACNVVVCYQNPPNMRSFLQRRGRARKSKSKYVMLDEGHDQKTLDTWFELELEMKKAYRDEMRNLEEVRSLEAADGHKEFKIDSTG